MKNNMTPADWRSLAKFVILAAIIFYLKVSLVTPQEELWKKPSRRLLIVFIVVWTITIAFILYLFFGPY